MVLAQEGDKEIGSGNGLVRLICFSMCWSDVLLTTWPASLQRWDAVSSLSAVSVIVNRTDDSIDRPFDSSEDWRRRHGRNNNTGPRGFPIGDHLSSPAEGRLAPALVIRRAPPCVRLIEPSDLITPGRDLLYKPPD